MKNLLIGIIGGKGKMGQYFVSFFERNGYKVIVSDKRTKLTNRQLAKKADVVIVSVPINRTKAVIAEVAPLVKNSGVLFDLTPLKQFPMEAMKGAKASYFGCHPLFGPTNPIEGQLLIACPGHGKKWLDWWKNLLKKNNVIIKILTAQKHDQLMAYVQALAHFSDIAFADTLRKSKMPIHEIVSCQSPVYRLELDMMGRILNQDPELYANIQIGNPLSAKVMLDFVESCQALTDIVAKKDKKAFVRYFKNGSRYLGDFTKDAIVESDRLIKEMLCSGMSLQSLPKNLAKKYNLAVLGPKNTYSDQAASRFRPKAKIWYTSSINEIFELVRDGKIKYGFIPIDNSITGSVRQSLDEFYQGGVWIEAVVPLPIHLALLGVKKIPRKQVKTIYSHSQPFLQSRQYIKKYFPSAITIPVASTAAALGRAAKQNDPSAVAVGPAVAAKNYGLEVIQPSIEDTKTNTTYFALIRKTPKRLNLRNAKKTSIAFHFRKDSPGSLFTVLQDFAEAGINLTKIESRPNAKVRGEYVFYADFDGTISQPHVKKTLNLIKKKVAKLKILGCY